jgi:hypothetical protein
MLDAYPRAVINDSKDGFRRLMERQDPTIRKALEVEFRRVRGRSLPGAVELLLDDLGNDGDFRVSTNLASRAGIDEMETHKIVECALLGAAGLEQRILVMEATESVPGFREDELRVVEERYRGAWKQLGGEAQEARFQRVVSIGDLPDLNKRPSGEGIKLRRVLKLRDSSGPWQDRRPLGWIISSLTGGSGGLGRPRSWSVATPRSSDAREGAAFLRTSRVCRVQAWCDRERSVIGAAQVGERAVSRIKAGLAGRQAWLAYLPYARPESCPDWAAVDCGAVALIDGPYLSFAVVCEKVLQEADGVLSFIRIVDHVTVTMALPVGVEVPPEMVPPEPPVAVTFVLGLKSASDIDSVPVKVRIETPSGLTLPEFETSQPSWGRGSRYQYCPPDTVPSPGRRGLLVCSGGIGDGRHASTASYK